MTKADENSAPEPDLVHKCLIDGDERTLYRAPETLARRAKRTLGKRKGETVHPKIQLSGVYLDTDKEELIITEEEASIVSVESSTQSRYQTEPPETNHGRSLGVVQNQMGLQNLLVVRVTSDDSEVSFSSSELSRQVFGINDELITTTRQYSLCSFGKLQMQPASGPHIVDGVLDVKIDMQTTGVLQSTVENEVTRIAMPMFGNANFIMYCLPKGTGKSWIAYGYFQWWRTVYNDDWCGYMSANVHEIAHNIGLKHSNEGGGLYKDQSGMMGFSYRRVGRPSMCFNGHKYWLLGYMRDRHLSLDLDNGPWKGKLVAFVDYKETDRGEYTIIKVGDLYVLYNRAKDFNRETVERFDQVTITKAADDLSDSIAMGGIDGLSPIFKDDGIVIQICSQQFGDKDIMELSIYRELKQRSLCGLEAAPRTPQPTPFPSKQPTPHPTHEPTLMPTTEPPVVTTAAPTPQPTMRPTTEGYCDDDEEATFLAGETAERCVWLRHRPEMIALMCVENSDAYVACPETCGACVDHCEDTDNKYTYEDSRRNCVWLQLRPDIIPEVCLPGSEAVRACPETCNACDAPKPSTSPTQTPTVSPTSRPTPLPTAPSFNPTLWPTPLSTLQPTSPSSAKTQSPALSSTLSPTSQSASPQLTALPTKAPVDVSAREESTLAPVAMTKCDDDYETRFYVESLDEMQWCIWLSSRPEQQAVLCHPNHNSSAYFICAETCGRCHDVCEDSSTATFVVGDAVRDCFWLSLRAHLVDELCVEGSDAWNGCPESCNVCDDVPAVCDDDPISTIYVEDLEESHPCIWLAARPDQIETLCQPDNPAYHVCAETCGKCKDDCEDQQGSFHVGSVLRDCLWLSLRPRFQEEECRPGKEAWDICHETCENCGVVEVSRADLTDVETDEIAVDDGDPAGSPPEAPVCDDSKTARFFVEDSEEVLQGCVWLAARPEQVKKLCDEEHPEGVRYICRETCGTCVDSCEDTDIDFEYNGDSKNCLWLSLRHDVQQRICKPGQPAYRLCPETCDVCDL